MKKFIVILITKILYFIGFVIGKGSSLPGKIALKLYPDILSDLVLPENIVIITGSNGKTTTAGMINDILVKNGFSVGYNFEGSNQIEGITTLLLRISDLSGKVNKDVLVLEVDERYTKHVLKYVIPKYYVVTNLYRDQLTRNGHPEYIYSIISQGIKEEMHLVLNTDDPLSSMMGMNRERVTYFGVDKNCHSKESNISIYNDGVYCPNCKGKLEYEYYHYNHIGSYKCKNCGHKRHKPQFCVTEIDFDEGNFVINDGHRIGLSFKSFFNIYNLLTAFTVASLLGVANEDICSSLNNYIIKKERIIEFQIAQKKGMMLVSKHENSISYNQSLMYIVNQREVCTVVIIVDSVSRKYYTSETSWLWDIDFEILKDDNVKGIILAGKYAYDLGVRFEHTGIDKDKISIIPDLDRLMEVIGDTAIGKIYVLTCFSDKKKFTDRVKKWN
ncbi:MAG: MurT ligase domain-containing protein [Mahellales bacterium]